MEAVFTNPFFLAFACIAVGVLAIILIRAWRRLRPRPRRGHPSFRAWRVQRMLGSRPARSPRDGSDHGFSAWDYGYPGYLGGDGHDGSHGGDASDGSGGGDSGGGGGGD